MSRASWRTERCAECGAGDHPSSECPNKPSPATCPESSDGRHRIEVVSHGGVYDAYGAAGLVEQAEFSGHVVGNGHHIRQQIAELACAAVEAHRPNGRDPGLAMALDHLLREWERVRRAREGW